MMIFVIVMRIFATWNGDVLSAINVEQDKVFSMIDYDLKNISFFDGFSSEQLKLLRTIFLPFDCAEGVMLFEQDDPAENIYLVVQGEVNIVFKPDDAPELVVARVTDHGVVGWSAAIGRPTYTSSAICKTDCKLLKLRHKDLHDFSVTYPELGNLVLEHLADLISERLRNTHSQVMDLLLQGLHLRVEHSFSSK